LLGLKSILQSHANNATVIDVRDLGELWYVKLDVVCWGELQNVGAAMQHVVLVLSVQIYAVLILVEISYAFFDQGA